MGPTPPLHDCCFSINQTMYLLLLHAQKVKSRQYCPRSWKYLQSFLHCHPGQTHPSYPQRVQRKREELMEGRNVLAHFSKGSVCIIPENFCSVEIERDEEKGIERNCGRLGQAVHYTWRCYLPTLSVFHICV